jgi:hypothetical protein
VDGWLPSAKLAHIWTYPQLTPSGIRQQQTTLLIILQPQIFPTASLPNSVCHPRFWEGKSVLPVFYVAICEGTGWKTAKTGTFLGFALPFGCRFCQLGYRNVALDKLLLGILITQQA